MNISWFTISWNISSSSVESETFASSGRILSGFQLGYIQIQSPMCRHPLSNSNSTITSQKFLKTDEPNFPNISYQWVFRSLRHQNRLCVSLHLNPPLTCFPGKKGGITKWINPGTCIFGFTGKTKPKDPSASTQNKFWKKKKSTFSSVVLIVFCSIETVALNWLCNCNKKINIRIKDSNNFILLTCIDSRVNPISRWKIPNYEFNKSINNQISKSKLYSKP